MELISRLSNEYEAERQQLIELSAQSLAKALAILDEHHAAKVRVATAHGMLLCESAYIFGWDGCCDCDKDSCIADELGECMTHNPYL